jgi:hypothetical protein
VCEKQAETRITPHSLKIPTATIFGKPIFALESPDHRTAKRLGSRRA